MREVIITSILQGFRFKFTNLGLALGLNLTLCISVAKGINLKLRKFYGLIRTFIKVTREKLVGGGLFVPSS